MQHSTHAECNPNWGAGITSWVIYYNYSTSFLVLYVRIKRFGCLVPVFSTEAHICLYTEVVGHFGKYCGVMQIMWFMYCVNAPLIMANMEVW